jgi:replicative DNA helicase
MKKIQETMDEVIEAIKNPIPGLPTGLKSVTKATGGFKPGQLIVIAGRSSMGKTAYGVGDVCLAQDPKDKVIVFSLEMSNIVLIQRLIANKANVEFRTLIDNKCSDKERARVREAMKWLNNTNIHIDDTPCLTPDQFWDKCEQHDDAKLIIIDHLHLMRHDDGTLKDVKALDDICQQIRVYGKENNVPIILIAQLNRNPEDRENHEPILADLRGSGGIEQDSDIVLLLFRPSYYLQREIDWDEKDDGDAFVIIAKQRNGITGKIKAVFMGEYMSYRDSPDETMEDWTR